MDELLSNILEFPDVLLTRDAIIDLFTDSVFTTHDEMISSKMVYPGKLYNDNGSIMVVVKGSGSELIESKSTNINYEDKRLDFQDKFTLKIGMIDNYVGSPIETTYGRFLLNYVLLVKPFGSVINYINDTWNIGAIEDEIAAETIEGNITPKQVFTYIDNIYFLGSYTDFCVPAMSEKSIVSNPDVSNRRDELFEKYKDQLDDPNVMMKIEDELIAMDKAALDGDVSNGFMINSKNYDVQRKRMFLTIGMLESFGDDVKGYEFSTTNLNDGWKEEDLDSLANDTRRGSYNRAKSTAKGGAESKYLGRTFQESKIAEEDCGTKRSLSVTITKDNYNLFIFRNMISGNKLIPLTKDNINSYIGKTVSLRSPMYCNTKTGYCYTCMDTRFKKLNVKLLNSLPINIGSAILLASMKAMHGQKLSIFSIDSLNEYLI